MIGVATWGFDATEAQGINFTIPASLVQGTVDRLLAELVTPAGTSTGPWLKLPGANAPKGRQGHTAVWTGREMIVWGGQGSSGFLQSGARFDPATSTWTARGPAFTVRNSEALAVASDGKLYLIGGHNTTFVATVEEYDPATNAWYDRAPLPTARANLGAVGAGNGKIYAIGGNNQSGNLATVEEATIANGASPPLHSVERGWG